MRGVPKAMLDYDLAVDCEELIACRRSVVRHDWHFSMVQISSGLSRMHGVRFSFGATTPRELQSRPVFVDSADLVVDEPVCQSGLAHIILVEVRGQRAGLLGCTIHNEAIGGSDERACSKERIRSRRLATGNSASVVAASTRR